MRIRVEGDDGKMRDLDLSAPDTEPTSEAKT
jgi:hypothetical protein